MKTEEVEFYWPQMWCVYCAGYGQALTDALSHLLITRPTESNALESFILERAEESTHSAMLVCLLNDFKSLG
jgi:hypothetical protein